MHRLTISLNDEEFADLVAHAFQERRTTREMAAYLVAKNTPQRPSSGLVVTGGDLTWGNGTLRIFNDTVAAPSVPMPFVVGNTAN